MYLYMDTIEYRRVLLVPDMGMNNHSTNKQKFGTAVFTNLGSDQILKKSEEYI
jgi:hypothetical protein